MKPSKLVENAWGNMGYSRYTYSESEVLAAVYGPYESRNSQKSDYKKSNIEVVISDISTNIDHLQNEKVLSDLFSSVIEVEQYPYLTIMICIQIFSKDERILSACINAVYQAIIQAKLQIKHKVIARDFFNNDNKITLAIVPKTDFILLSLCNKPIDFHYYKECINLLVQEREFIS